MFWDTLEMKIDLKAKKRKSIERYRKGRIKDQDTGPPLKGVAPHSAVSGLLLLFPERAVLPFAVIGQSLNPAIKEDDADEENDEDDGQHRQHDQQQIRLQE